MQCAGVSRALLRWGLGGILLAAAALALLLWTGDDRAGAAELPAPSPGFAVPLPEPIGGVVGGLEATGEQVVGTILDPVLDDAGAVVIPGVGTVDPGALPVIGDVLGPGTLPLPLPVPELPGAPVLPVPSPGPAPRVVTPTGAARAGPTAPAATAAAAVSRNGAASPAPDLGDAPAATASSLDHHDGVPATPSPDPLGPLGTVASAIGGATTPGLVLVAVLAAFAWAVGRGPGRRLAELGAVALGGPPVTFERPG